MTYKATEFYACWIAVNGRSEFKHAQRLHIDPEWWEEGDEGWQRGGNSSAPLSPGFHFSSWGGYTYVHRDKYQVDLVIKAAEGVLTNIRNAWGLEDSE